MNLIETFIQTSVLIAILAIFIRFVIMRLIQLFEAVKLLAWIMFSDFEPIARLRRQIFRDLYRILFTSQLDVEVEEQVTKRKLQVQVSGDTCESCRQNVSFFSATSMSHCTSDKDFIDDFDSDSGDSIFLPTSPKEQVINLTTTRSGTAAEGGRTTRRTNRN